ncbi:MAG: hypothetical protein ABII13_02115 [Patescibacteria group bacterium]|nr:hypothetical protein [Patescibacteria group bacterium]MBU2509001.1 hypothetical protein [Patescibacteria group bacterium]
MEPFYPKYTAQILSILRSNPHNLAEEQGARITVDHTVSRFAFLYEKIRNVVDYKDEHLIRKAAISRILKRQLMLESNPDLIADRLVKELIGARYLANGILDEAIINKVSLPIKKYLALSKVKAGPEKHLNWMRGLIAVEIEEILVDASEEKALITFLYERLLPVVRVRGLDLSETELHLQVYIACYRALIKADSDMLGYKLLRAYLPEWMHPQEWLENPRPIAERLVALERRIKLRLRHPLSQKFLRIVKPWAVSLGILRDVLKEKPEEIEELLMKPEDLAIKIARKAEERYKRAKTKLRRGTVRAIIYLFLTKMLVALLVEVPLEWLWYEDINRLALAVNLLFPPALMFLVGLLIKVPGQANTQKLKDGVKKLLDEEPIVVGEIRAPKQRTGTKRFWFTITYAATFLLSFGLIYSILRAIDFTGISIVIFIFFLCIVSFFGFRLRMTAREVVVVEGRQRTWSVLADFLSLPILRAGQWLSRGISRFNVFVFIFDFLFEAPFKIFLTVLEEWFSFMREKKDELQ